MPSPFLLIPLLPNFLETSLCFCVPPKFAHCSSVKTCLPLLSCQNFLESRSSLLNARASAVKWKSFAARASVILGVPSVRPFLLSFLLQAAPAPTPLPVRRRDGLYPVSQPSLSISCHEYPGLTFHRPQSCCNTNLPFPVTLTLPLFWPVNVFLFFTPLRILCPLKITAHPHRSGFPSYFFATCLLPQHFLFST